MSISNWTIDPAHSDVLFSIKHLGLSTVRGKFNTVSGTASFDPTDLSTLSLNASIDVASVDTGNDQRDGHLKAPDFFDAEQFPHITFTTTGVASHDPSNHEITGDLTIRGVTKPVVLKVEGPEGPLADPYGQTKVGATATTSIHRKDFGLTFQSVLDSGALLLGEEVKITLEIQFIQG
jgi:polyisoprenoid-binding protein YceI